MMRSAARARLTTFLALLFLAGNVAEPGQKVPLVAQAGSSDSAGESQAPRTTTPVALAAGPWLQWTRDTSARIWFKLDGAGEATVRIGTSHWSQSVDETTGYAGYVQVGGLQAATKYTYELTVGGVDSGIRHSFWTMPAEGAPGAFDLYVISDHHMLPAHAGGRMEAEIDAAYKALWSVIQERDRPCAILSIGDHEIALDDEINERRKSLVTLRTMGAYRNTVHASVPTYYVWDDQDFGANNGAGMVDVSKRAVSCRAYREFWAGAPPLPDSGGLGIWQGFKLADVPILMLDNRTYRSRTPATKPASSAPWTPNGENDQCWGDEQLAWLRERLIADAGAPFKVACTGGQLMDQVAPNLRAWVARDSEGIFHRRERNEIVEFLAAHPDCNSGLVWFKGDDHISQVIEGSRFREAVGYEDGVTATPRAEVPYLEAQARMLVCGGTFGRLSSLLSRPWHGHPDEKFIRESKSFWQMRYDTARVPPAMEARCYSLDDGQVIYEFTGVGGGDFVLPVSGYRSVSPGVLVTPEDGRMPGLPAGSPAPQESEPQRQER